MSILERTPPAAAGEHESQDKRRAGNRRGNSINTNASMSVSWGNSLLLMKNYSDNIIKRKRPIGYHIVSLLRFINS